MPNSLLLIPLLTLILTTCILGSPLNTTIGAVQTFGGCWVPPTPALIYRDCVDIIRNQVGSPHDPDVILTFGIRPTSTVLIPYAKSSKRGNCGIVLGIKGDNVRITETDSFQHVKQVALDVAAKCIIRPPHLGGWGWAGVRGNLLVSVIGRETGLQGEE